MKEGWKYIFPMVRHGQICNNEALTKLFVVVGSPENIPLRHEMVTDGMVLEQHTEHIGRQGENIILEDICRFFHLR